ncbi:uncharacterized protein LOC126904972 [Daktulosphaira vitifoliae]|uniref:uncharacterized protein LOC126904972 n=1 Tax=Daktulosphaira vitifoliae TaxID=58002 RepID=UPI0021A9C3B8|nr:uncharacterized protein LOC126904972 [Daktulosphaira vitifoliae]
MLNFIIDVLSQKTIVSAIAVYLIYVYTTWSFSYWAKLGVKCPWSPVPLFGHFIKSILGLQHTMEVFDTIYQKMGDEPFIGVYTLRIPQLMIKDPEIVGRVLIKDFQHFTDRGIYADVHTNPLNNNIFFTSGERWRTMRKKLSPTFTLNKLKHMIEQIKECSDSLLMTLRQTMTEEKCGKIEIREMMAKYSTDVIGSCAFGLKLDAINDPKSEFRKHGKAVCTPSIYTQIWLAIIFIQPSILRMFRLNNYSKKNITFFQDVFQETIRKRELYGDKRKDYVYRLMKARKELVLNPDTNLREKFTETDIVANAYILFLAGFETVSTTISLCLYEMALNKDVQRKVREEIMQIQSKNGGNMDSDSLNSLHYTSMVIKETLRKYPPLIALNREVTEPYLLPGTNITLEKGMKIIIPINSIHYDPLYFPNPFDFNPERFSEENIGKLRQNTYIPFGDGPRICIGKRFAEYEIKLALSEVLINYEVLPCEKTKVPVQFVIGTFVNQPKSVWLKFKSINGIDLRIFFSIVSIYIFCQSFKLFINVINWSVIARCSFSTLCLKMFKVVIECFDLKFTFLAIVLGVLYSYSTWYYNYWLKLNIKCLRPPIPLFGHFFYSIIGRKHTMDIIDNIYQKMGDEPFVGMYNMRTPELLIKDTELIGQVLIKNFNNFTDRGIYYDAHVNPLHNNIFHIGGEKWRTMRQKLSPTFTTNKLKNMIDQIKECSDSLLSTIGQLVTKESGLIEIRDLMGKYSIDVIGSCAFGLKLDAINDPKSEFRKYGKAVFTPSYWSLLRNAVIFTQPSLASILQMNNYPFKNILFFRNAFEQTIRAREQSGIDRKDLVQQLMKARNDLVINPALRYKDKYSELDIVANAHILFVAGFETVSTSMSFCLYELALRKDIQDKVRNEILKVKSENNNGELNSDCLGKLHYLHMVIKETLRKYPPLAVLNRQVTQAYTLPGTSITLTPGTKIIIPVRSIHYNPKYYPNPTEFDPERFSDENIDKVHPNIYMPFGSGPRLCIAKRFAEMEMKLALSEVLINYEVLPCKKTQIPIKYIIGSFVSAPESIWLKFRSKNI